MENNQGIGVTFLDATGAKSVKAMVSRTVIAKNILPIVITKMLLPTVAPDGTPMSYALDWKEGGIRVREDQNLSDLGIQSGHHLVLYPEIVAGL